jgi:hypothetical protein
MMALILPIGGAKQFLCSDITQGGRLNARTIKRNSGGRRCVEVRWRMYFHDSDFYSRFLALGLRKLLAAKKHKRQKEKSSFVPFCGYYQLTTSSSASCQTGRFGRIAQRYSLSG